MAGLAASIAAVPGAWAQGRVGGAGRAPNIIYIMADDLGYGDLGCYGQEILTTPNIDRLAHEGIRFTDCYAASAVCAPSRCGLMTGLHMGHARVRGNGGVPLEPEDVTVAEVLRDAGYRTGIFGKWGLGREGSSGVPNLQGFDEWFGYLHQGRAHNYYPDYVWENQERYPLPGNRGGRRETYTHDLFTERGLDFVTRHARDPFFLYMAYTVPHANNELGHETGDGMEVPAYGRYADRDWPNPQKGHAAMIDRLDRDVGRLLRRLEALGIDDETVILFTSDNGPHREGGADPDFFDSNGPLRGIKRDLYEGGIRVPMIVRWPQGAPAGVVSDHPWAFWDFMPTAAELAGTSGPSGSDGLSMAGALTGGTAPHHDYLYWEFHEGGFHQAVRMGDLKAVRRRNREAPIEVYRLDRDPGEEHDVSSELPGAVSRAERLFSEARVDSPEFPVRERPS
jgi:arylsulfatase A-like enzyme